DDMGREYSLLDDILPIKLVRFDDGSTATPADLLAADAGGIEIRGTEGADVLYGTAFADTLFGEGGDDLLEGGAGDDALAGGVGADVLVGGKKGGTGADARFRNKSQSPRYGGSVPSNDNAWRIPA
ncbi:MAG: hypothetical protein L6Q55_15895, partial [Azonexus sp.]|nr:hypothetical protein [Rhodocyclaceae bacterium]MCK6413886.1 hypothetical protein [Azonexus sp.]